MSYPLLSIIIPIYNVEEYLEQCIKSVINQTYRNLEIILIDDGSRDSSGHICDRMKEIDSRIIVIHQENKGLSGARNAGLDIAKGEYIAFVDSDDWIDCKMYEVLYKGLIRTGADISQCSFLKTRNSFLTQKEKRNVFEYEIIGSVKAQNRMYKDNFLEYVVVWNKLYSKTIFENIRFPVGKINEDEFVNYKIYMKAKKITVFKEAFYYYRQRPGSIMSQKYSEKKLDAIEALTQRGRFYKKKKMYSLYVSSLIYRNELVHQGFEQCQKDSLNYKIRLKLCKYVLYDLVEYCISDKVTIAQKVNLIKILMIGKI